MEKTQKLSTAFLVLAALSIAYYFFVMRSHVSSGFFEIITELIQLVFLIYAIAFLFGGVYYVYARKIKKLTKEESYGLSVETGLFLTSAFIILGGVGSFL